MVTPCRTSDVVCAGRTEISMILRFTSLDNSFPDINHLPFLPMTGRVQVVVILGIIVRAMAIIEKTACRLNVNELPASV